MIAQTLVVRSTNEEVESGRRGRERIPGRVSHGRLLTQPRGHGGAMEAGWLHTGQMGYYDEKGLAYIVDRRRDMITTEGENIFLRRVVEML